MGDAAGRHVPVMLDRCVELLAPALEGRAAVAIDGTVGLGGHAEAVLTAFPEVRVVGIDRDPHALAAATERLAPFGDRFVAHRARYDDIAGALSAARAATADAVLLDLGLSSLQIDTSSRGFAYSQDAPLDMRMDPDEGRTAADLLRDADEEEIARILREYGEERHARRIARAVVARRAESPIRTSAELVELVRATVPPGPRSGSGHPAKRVFQALRIAVNDEIDILARALPAAIEAVRVGGRVVVLAYHSLEDRLVKRTFAAGAEVATPPGIPVVPDRDLPYLRLVTRGAERPGDDEIESNPRSASARLRAAERIRVTPPERRAA